MAINSNKLHKEEIITSKIYFIRNHKVMIDRDLASMYGVDTRTLNQAVRRNIMRFPEDFMFQLSHKEFIDWKSQIVISNKEKMGLRKPPLVFTEQGVAMLSSVLNSETAIMVNIQIIRVFSKMRRMLRSTEKILRKMGDLERSIKLHDQKIQVIFKYLKQMEEKEINEEDFKNRQRIGYRKNNDKKQ